MKTGSRNKTFHQERGMELLELALVLPLLLVLTAGAMDFGNAWNVRQILANAAREGARLGSTQPMLDLNTTDPQTIQQICQDVADYLARANVSTTFMDGTSTDPSAGCATPTAIPNKSTMLANPVPLGWTYFTTQSNQQYGLEIQRTVLVPSSSGNASGSVSSTVVTLTYPYTWTFGFNRLIAWVSGSGYNDVLSIQVNSTMANTD
jgi:Flp pilus assembly protein TadG